MQLTIFWAHNILANFEKFPLRNKLGHVLGLRWFEIAAKRVLNEKIDFLNSRNWVFSLPLLNSNYLRRTALGGLILNFWNILPRYVPSKSTLGYGGRSYVNWSNRKLLMLSQFSELSVLVTTFKQQLFEENSAGGFNFEFLKYFATLCALKVDSGLWWKVLLSDFEWFWVILSDFEWFWVILSDFEWFRVVLIVCLMWTTHAHTYIGSIVFLGGGVCRLVCGMPVGPPSIGMGLSCIEAIVGLIWIIHTSTYTGSIVFLAGVVCRFVCGMPYGPTIVGMGLSCIGSIGV